MSEPAPSYPSPALVVLVRDGALDLMKMSADNADATRVERQAAVVLTLIGNELGHPLTYATPWLEGMPYDETNIPAPVLEAAILATREMYLRKDSPFGITGAWSQDGESMRISSDPLAGVRHLLAGYQAGWGIA